MCFFVSVPVLLLWLLLVFVFGVGVGVVVVVSRCSRQDNASTMYAAQICCDPGALASAGPWFAAGNALTMQVVYCSPCIGLGVMAQVSKALQGAAAEAALAQAAATTMASVVLADPSAHPNSGLVLALAPLMGAAACLDTSHPKWLHVHVRPPVRGLLKLLKVGVCVLATH